MDIPNSIQSVTADEYDKVVKINQYSQFYGLKHVFPSMKKTENGSIVNVSSTGGIEGIPSTTVDGKVTKEAQAMDTPLPVGRIGQPEDISKLLIYLASDDSS